MDPKSTSRCSHVLPGVANECWKQVKDAIGRKWQCSTIQLDFNLPERFDLTYKDEHGEKQRPILIHRHHPLEFSQLCDVTSRAIFGSLERFFGILIENCKGAFDFWLAPVQCRILPVREEFLPYCQEVMERMKGRGLRAEILSGERMGKLIRNAETAKTPVMCVVGEKETASEALSVRTYAHGDAGAFPATHVIDAMVEAAQNPDNKQSLYRAFGQTPESNGH